MPMTIDLRNLAHPPEPPASALQTLQIASQSMQGWRFEWHQQSRNVYVIRPSHPHRGDKLAGDIATPDHARQVVQVFIAGFKDGMRRPACFEPAKGGS